MWVKCECRRCGRTIEFETLHAGSTIPCPHCGKATMVYVPARPNQPGRVEPPSVYGARIGARIEEYLLLLQDQCLVRDPLPAEMLNALEKVEPGRFATFKEFRRFLKQRWPQALVSRSCAARKRQEARMMRQILREGESGPTVPVPDLPARKPGEEDATVRQKQFLRTLGVRDERLLDELGRSQAGFLIDWAVDHRIEQSET